MPDALSRLEPRSVWSYFEHIVAIPRPSKHEERIAAWVRQVAAEHGWPVRSDATGNLVLDVPATKGRERAPVVVLQGHLDMVAEKNKDVRHDFMKDPIRTAIDGEWVRAEGTTLGADNGIGVAAALAAASDPAVQHGPLELLFTIDEETGLTGAQHLDGSLLRGRTLLNLDSEDDGKIFVGCAGGRDCHVTLAAETVAAPAGHVALRLVVRGLRGGHSGLNIVDNRANALKLAGRVLAAALEGGIDFALASFEGGSKHNAIPREADAMVTLAPANVERLRGVLACMLEGFRTEFAGMDDGLAIALEEVATPARVLAPSVRDRLLRLVAVLPHGVLAMSHDLAGLVETSSNLAVIDSADGELRIVTSSRSSVAASLDAVTASIRAAAALAGAKAEMQDGYPGWKPNLDSPALAVTREVYREVWGAEPEVTAVHAGLECGLLGRKVPGLDMVSFGPDIKGAHSPDERVHIASVGRFWKALSRVLDRLSS